MLVGLLSDTHIDVPSKRLPPQIKEAFRGVDRILHAGDIWIPSTLDELESIAPVTAAWGDDDLEIDLGHDNRMMKGQTLLLDGVTLWLTHIKPLYALINPYGLTNPKVHLFNPKKQLSSPGPEDPKGPPDVVVFGHTHLPTIEYFEDVLLVNPGSPTLNNYVPKLGTIGLLTIDSGKVEARIVQL